LRKQLRDELTELKRRRDQYRTTSRAYPYFGWLLLLVSGVLFAFVSRSWWVYIVSFYGLVFALSPAISPVRGIEIRTREVESELDLLNISEKSREQRAEKLFKLHQFELKKYYDQTLRHSSWIFVVGIICILLGFAIIGFTIYLVSASTALTNIPEKVVSAVLGAVGGILANFIAVVYLKMHSETVKSLTEFHNRLVVTHHLHFANFLLSKIKKPELRETTLAAVASALADGKK
jgi:hypothetical protein